MNVPASRQASWKEGAPSDYATREIVHWPGWRNLIGWDIFLNNLTAGIFLITLLAWWLVPAASAELIAPAITLAWLVLIADLLVLVADLGDPWRLLHMLRVFRRQSPMSVGVWSLSSFAALLTLVLVAAWLPWPVAHTLAKWFSLLAVPPALGVLIYKGVLFSCTSQPGLRDARWLSAHLAGSGLMLGAAVLMLLASLLDSPVRETLRGVMFALLVLAAITLALLHRNVMTRMRQRYSLGTRQAIYWIVAVFGLVLPLVLVTIVPGNFSLEGAAVLALVGSLVLRQALVRLAEPMS